MRIFITGATGFAGSHLVEQVLADGHEVYALVHAATSHQPLPEHPRVHGVDGDLMDLASLTTAVARAAPDVIYHLAGQAYPGKSWQNAARTLAINTGGTANLLEAAVAYGRPRVVVVTSAEIYNVTAPDQMPLTESTPPHPRHPYGVSKAAAGQLIPVYHARYGLEVMEARPFNHIGPHQALGFVVPDFASQLAAIKLGQKEQKILVGNLKAERDITDVRDVARAYIALAENGRAGEAYIICSGQPISIHYLLNTLIEMTGTAVEVEYDPARMRPSDTPILYGSYAKIKAHTGWQPQVHLRRSLADALQEWEEKLSNT